MGSVFTPLHHAANHRQEEALHHNASSPKTHSTFTAVPGMTLISHEHAETNPRNTIPQTTWEQYSYPDHGLLAGSVEMTNWSFHTYRESHPDTQYHYEPIYSVQWTPPGIFMSEDAFPSPRTESTRLEMSPNDSQIRRGPSATQSYEQKSQRVVTRPTARMKECLENDRKTVKARNRTASNKFRLKKEGDIKKLQATEIEMEQVNEALASRVSDLTTQVHHLKMELLQHANCGCDSIQIYIASEASQYIDSLDSTKLPRPAMN